MRPMAWLKRNIHSSCHAQRWHPETCFYSHHVSVCYQSIISCMHTYNYSWIKISGFRNNAFVNPYRLWLLPLGFDSLYPQFLDTKRSASLFKTSSITNYINWFLSLVVTIVMQFLLFNSHTTLLVLLVFNPPIHLLWIYFKKGYFENVVFMCHLTLFRPFHVNSHSSIDDA